MCSRQGPRRGLRRLRIRRRRLALGAREEPDQPLQHLRQLVARHIFEDAIVGIYESTRDGRLLSVNPSMAQMFGFDSPGEMIASITDIQTQLYVDPDQREEFKRRMLEHKMLRRFEVQLYRKDRSTMWVCMNARVIRRVDNAVRYKGSLEDITDRKLLEDELRQKLATRVEIRLRGKDKGQVILTFESNDDFERLLEVLRK